MRPGPFAAFEAMATSIDPLAAPRPARAMVAEICVSRGWASSEDEAAERAEKWEQAFLEYARREANQLAELGRPCRYSFNSSSDYMLQGCAFIEPGDDDSVKAAKRQKARAGEYLQYIHELTAREFECLCGGLLALLGVREPRITQASRDEGIDFFGRMELEYWAGDVFPSVSRQLSAWMVGQAKQYREATVSTFEVRDLVGAVHLARGGAYSAAQRETEYAALRPRACDPVFFLFVTTGSLSSSSWRLIKASGVVGMDGSMVADFLASRDVAQAANGSTSLAALRAWALSFER